MASTLWLASASPRRRELLQQIGVEFQVQVADIDETPQADEAPADYVERLALSKATAVLTSLGDQSSNQSPCVLGADTIVVCDGQLLGKPADAEQAAAMLGRLSGRAHQVMTAVALVNADRQCVETSVAQVYFRPISRSEIQRYWQTGEPADKAGGYGIQGLAAIFVERLEGSYSAVVGLPLYETAQLLVDFDVPVWCQAGPLD